MCVYSICVCVFSHHALEVYVSLCLWRDPTSHFLKPFIEKKKTFNFGQDAKTVIVSLLCVCLPVGDAEGDADGRLCDADGM